MYEFFVLKAIDIGNENFPVLVMKILIFLANWKSDIHSCWKKHESLSRWIHMYVYICRIAGHFTT